MYQEANKFILETYFLKNNYEYTNNNVIELIFYKINTKKQKDTEKSTKKMKLNNS